MSIASDCLKLGVGILLDPDIAGEYVTFRGESTNANVNRLSDDGKEAGGQISTNTKETVVVQFAYDITAPQYGELITTSDDHVYRIDLVKYIGHAWQCHCSVKR